MIARLSLLVLGVALLPGCGNLRKETIDPGVLADLTTTAHERQAPPPLSPYGIRSSAPGDQEGSAAPTVAQAQHADPATPPVPAMPPTPTAPAVAIPVVLTHDAGVPPASIPPGLAGVTKPVPPPQAKPEDPLTGWFRCHREGRTAEANAHLKKVDPAAREQLAVLLPLVSRVAQTCKTGRPQEFSAMLDALEGLAQSLRPRAALTLDRMAFCRNIEKFGVYDPLPPEHTFQVACEGRPGDLVQVYVELRNFSSIKNGAFNETALACTLEIHDDKGHVVWRQDRPARVEQSRSPRRDGYLGCHFYVPPRLPIGDYTLWIHVKDMTGLSQESVPAHRAARQSLAFHVRSAGVARVSTRPGE